MIPESIKRISYGCIGWLDKNHYICLSGSPSTIKWNCKLLYMGKVRLKVLTVPALDPVTYYDHTAFCVSTQTGGKFQYAPGWTLRDAIECYCEWFRVDRDQIVLERPFLPQRVLSDDCQ